MIAAPLFHGFGLLGANLALALGSPVVLRRRFDPERTRVRSYPARVLAGYQPAALRRR